MKKNHSIFATIFMIISTFLFVFPSYAHADDNYGSSYIGSLPTTQANHNKMESSGSFIIFNNMTKRSLLSNVILSYEGYYQPDLTEYQSSDYSATSELGFNVLFGSGYKKMIYQGEVPYYSTKYNGGGDTSDDPKSKIHPEHGGAISDITENDDGTWSWVEVIATPSITGSSPIVTRFPHDHETISSEDSASGEFSFREGLNGYFKSNSNHFANLWKRTWNKRPEVLTGETYLKDDGKSAKSDSDKVYDLHSYNLAHPSNIVSDILNVLGSVGFSILSWVNGLIGWFIGLALNLAYIPVQNIADSMGLGSLLKNIQNLFLYNYDTKSWSPIFIFAAIAFTVGLIGALISRLTSGSISLMELLKELGFAIIAIIVFWMAPHALDIQNSLLSTADKFVDAVADLSSQGNTNPLINLAHYNFNNSRLSDSQQCATDQATAQINYVSVVIAQQFGVSSIKELNYDDNTVQANWGITSEQMNKVLNSIAVDVNGRTDGAISVNNGKDEVKNIGVWWYASMTNTNPRQPFYIGDVAINQDGKTTTIKAPKTWTGDTDNLFFTVDFIAGVDAQAGGTEKTQKIMTTFQSPGYDTFSLLFVIMSNIMLVWVLLVCALLAGGGKIIFTAGIVCVPILPPLILIKQTRTTAKQLLVTWIGGLLKIIVGLAGLKLALYINVLLFDAGFVGRILDIVILFFMAKKYPELAKSICSVADKKGLKAVAKVDDAWAGALNRNPIKDGMKLGSLAKNFKQFRHNNKVSATDGLQLNDDGAAANDTSLEGGKTEVGENGLHQAASIGETIGLAKYVTGKEARKAIDDSDKTNKEEIDKINNGIFNIGGKQADLSNQLFTAGIHKNSYEYKECLRHSEKMEALIAKKRSISAKLLRDPNNIMLKKQLDKVNEEIRQEGERFEAYMVQHPGMKEKYNTAILRAKEESNAKYKYVAKTSINSEFARINNPKSELTDAEKQFKSKALDIQQQNENAANFANAAMFGGSGNEVNIKVKQKSGTTIKINSKHK